MDKLIEVYVLERSKLITWQKALEGEGWSPWSMHQWMYLEGKIAALNSVLYFYYANVKKED